jgi:hypothetical protein
LAIEQPNLDGITVAIFVTSNTSQYTVIWWVSDANGYWFKLKVRQREVSEGFVSTIAGETLVTCRTGMWLEYVAQVLVA